MPVLARRINHLSLVCDNGGQEFLLFALRPAEMVERSGDLRSDLVDLVGRQRIQDRPVDLEPAVTSGFCALKAANTSPFSRSGTLK
jgi:hypothetical protein